MLTKQDVAKKLKVSEKQVDRLIVAHGLPAFKIGGVVRFREDMVDEWIDNREIGGKGCKSQNR